MHQLQQHSFALWTDRGQAPQVNNEFAGSKVCSGRLIGACEFSGPRCDELAFNDHGALVWALDNRDLQHAAGFLDVRERNPRSKRRRLQLLGFQRKVRGPDPKRRDCQKALTVSAPLDRALRIIARIDAQFLYPGQESGPIQAQARGGSVGPSHSSFRFGKRLDDLVALFLFTISKVWGITM